MGLRAYARRGVALAVVLILAVGCAWGGEEPGLFGRDPPTPSSTESPGSARDQRIDPDLPVVGDEIWTSGDGTAVTVRIAVHAVRRLAGATVLDWSVTVLSAPGLSTDATVRAFDLGLWSSAGSEVRLVDPRRRVVYEPLARRGEPGRCLCTDPDSARQNLRVAEPSLQQLAFPALPAATRTVDVVVPTVPVFSRVPVTPVGEVPLATTPVSLDWEPDPPPAAVWSPVRRFTYATGQQFAVSATRVIAGPSLTSVEWRIQALTAGEGLTGRRPPLADPELPAGATAITVTSADGSVRVVRSGDGARERALATAYGPWLSALRSAGQEVSVVTNVPALPNGTQRVRVAWPGLPAQPFAVLTAPDHSTRSTTRAQEFGRDWSSASGQRPGWSAADWPTPLPRADLVADFVARSAPLRR